SRRNAPKTIDYIHDVLGAVLRTAVEWGHLQDNPAHRVKPPKVTTVRPKWALTTEQAARLLEVLPPLAKTMVGLVLPFGIRRGGLFAGRWKTVNGQRRSSAHRRSRDGGRSDPLHAIDPAPAALASLVRRDDIGRIWIPVFILNRRCVPPTSKANDGVR